MALFTDGAAASMGDLRRYDSAAEGLARDLGIDLDAKLAVAAEEVGQEIFRFLLFHSASQRSLADLRWVAPGSEATRLRTGLSDVVVTPALRRWHALKALESLYRDAYGSDVTDRYRAKRDDYEKLARDAEDGAFMAGIGLARYPVPQAPLPAITAVSAPAQRNDCVLQVTWVGAAGNEGAPSRLWTSALGVGDQVLMTQAAPAGITGWNLYAAAQDDTPMLQNPTPLRVDAIWTLPAGGLQMGQTVVQGQLADYLIVEKRILPRG